MHISFNLEFPKFPTIIVCRVVDPSLFQLRIQASVGLVYTSAGGDTKLGARFGLKKRWSVPADYNSHTLSQHHRMPAAAIGSPSQRQRSHSAALPCSRTNHSVTRPWSQGFKPRRIRSEIAHTPPGARRRHDWE